MPVWVLLAVGAQLITAVSVLIDRHIVVKAQHIGKPIVYAFYVSVLSFFVVALIPFGVQIPSPVLLGFSALHAIAFFSAIFFLYSALAHARASDVAPVVGAISALTTLIAAPLLLDGDISKYVVAPIILLATGTALISHFHFTRKAVRFTLLSGVTFGVVAMTTKFVFIETTFVDGFFWTRMTSVLFACSLLLLPSLKAQIFSGGARSSSGARYLVIGNKLLGGSAAILTAFAISLGSVSVVNALSGLQFAFLFLFALIFAPSMPILREGGKTHGHGGWQTGIGVLVIATGLALLYTVSA
jgi:uncharacterized membrane protein